MARAGIAAVMRPAHAVEGADVSEHPLPTEPQQRQGSLTDLSWRLSTWLKVGTCPSVLCKAHTPCAPSCPWPRGLLLLCSSTAATKPERDLCSSISHSRGIFKEFTIFTKRINREQIPLPHYSTMTIKKSLCFNSSPVQKTTWNHIHYYQDRTKASIS